VNLAQMRDAVRTRIGVPSGDTFYTDQTLTDLVNEALSAIASEADWPWLETSTTFATVAGTGSYTPPADWSQTRSLCIDGYDAMEWRSLPEIREYLTTVRDVPTVYTVSGDVILLRPTPSAVYTVTHDYVKDESTLITDADVPLMPSGFHYSVVAFACHLAYLRSGDVQRATAALADFRGWADRMKSQRRRTRGPIRVRVRPGSAL
jgi:hypothetical protein